MTLVDAIGYLGGLCVAACFLPQVVRTWRTGSAEDVSMPMLLLNLGAAALCELYACLLGLTPIVVTNALFGLSVAVEIALKWHFDARRRDGRDAPRLRTSEP